ncbi:hypothetical protein [Sphingobacterium bovistauri]|uniref:Positive regulator of sigma(E), RseC/MucC n=1 Tax=Sphingobacterium bovistauri TaxID=2781959 RepID=A0ABS7Z855_9SPHI|nr:hypothetical protein [Sphingobacterium bovistauri]MCA5006376.1 hypothetical protein [Sphingobacterium bovistauri]
MKLIQLQTDLIAGMPNDKLTKAYIRLQNLLTVVESRIESEILIEKINYKIQNLNSSNKINGALFRLVNLTENEIINFIEQDLKIVPVGYYSKKWLAIGMTAFGIPFGIILGTALKNMALIGIGLPIGLGIGALIGRKKDTEAAIKGRQYNYLAQLQNDIN